MEPAPSIEPAPTEAPVEPEPPVEPEEQKYWALMNLLASALTTLIGLGMGLTYFKKKEEDEEEDGVTKTAPDDEENDEDKRRPSKFLGLIPAIGSIVLFVLTEDMRNPMTLTDKWTIWMALIALVNVVLAFATRNKKQENEDEDAKA